MHTPENTSKCTLSLGQFQCVRGAVFTECGKKWICITKFSLGHNLEVDQLITVIGCFFYQRKSSPIVTDGFAASTSQAPVEVSNPWQ